MHEFLSQRRSPVIQLHVEVPGGWPGFYPEALWQNVWIKLLPRTSICRGLSRGFPSWDSVDEPLAYFQVADR